MLDQAAPLPRLGLGLAKIREGHLLDGGRELEIAASLDPNNATVRSYLGKTYYEEKRTPLDEREYNVAKQLDPKDPTPYFYDAIAKQTTNRPVEALQDLEKAIELNDNRAVYRSELLLVSPGQKASFSLTGCHSLADTRLVSTVPCTETALAGAGAHAVAEPAGCAITLPAASAIGTTASTCLTTTRVRAVRIPDGAWNMRPPRKSQRMPNPKAGYSAMNYHCR